MEVLGKIDKAGWCGEHFPGGEHFILAVCGGKGADGGENGGEALAGGALLGAMATTRDEI